jgi:hypothetical protein
LIVAHRRSHLGEHVGSQRHLDVGRERGVEAEVDGLQDRGVPGRTFISMRTR